MLSMMNFRHVCCRVAGYEYNAQEEDKSQESRINLSEFPLWLIRLRRQNNVPEDMGLITGLAQWVRETVLLQTVV